MSCRKFETMVNELARASMMDAERRAGALAHAGTCARCAQRLADEKALTTGLRALSASAATMEAPARVESALLSAFREQKAAALDQKTCGAVLPMTERATSRWTSLWSWQAGAAIAATLLFAVTLGLLQASRRTTNTQPDGRALAQQEGEKIDVQLPVPVPLSVEEATNKGPEVIAKAATPPGPRMRPALLRSSRPAPRAFTNRASVTGDNPRTVSAGSSAAETAEIATDFMPLTYDGGALAMESGHVVRVELPRTALVSMGLPMNPERANELVKADVLLGDDGVARAIRFVR